MTQPSDNKGDAKARIMHAALCEFAVMGFDAATVRSICEAAGVNVAAVNYYFNSKENLYHEVIREQFEDFGVQLIRIPDKVHDEASWRAAVHEWVLHSLQIVVDDNPPHVWVNRLFMNERHNPSSQLPLLLDSFFKPVDESLRRLIRMGMPAGADEMDVQIWATSVHGQVSMLGQRSGPWKKILLPPDAERGRWLLKMAEHISSRIISELKYRPAAEKTP